jgi:hypothetical protein
VVHQRVQNRLLRLIMVHGGLLMLKQRTKMQKKIKKIKKLKKKMD